MSEQVKWSRTGICRGPRRTLNCGCSWGDGKPSSWCFSGEVVDAWVRDAMRLSPPDDYTTRTARQAYRHHFPGRWVPR